MLSKRWSIGALALVGLAAFAGVPGWWLLGHNPDAAKIEWQGYGALWGAAATLMTGLAAVGGAVFVGRRQADIQNRQTELQEKPATVQADIQLRQVALQEQSLRLELLERRADAIAQLSAFYRAHVPSSDLMDPEVRYKFHDDLTRARLIFPEVIGGLFQRCLDHLNNYSAQQQAADQNRRAGDVLGASNHATEARALIPMMALDFKALHDAMIKHARVEL